MLDKNIKKQEAKNRPTWVGYYTRKSDNKNVYSRKTKHKDRYY